MQIMGSNFDKTQNGSIDVELYYYQEQSEGVCNGCGLSFMRLQVSAGRFTIPVNYCDNHG